jgi:predicted MFS family arabinose efflux permease
MALIVTPTGRVLRRSVEPDALPEVFAAQFSLSHLAWLITYPIAGWAGTHLGFTLTWSILAALAAAGLVAAWALWPREAEVDAEAREVEVFTHAPFGDTPLGHETESAVGTLAACQCTCVRPV